MVYGGKVSRFPGSEGWWERWDLHPVGRNGDGVTARLGSFTFNAPEMGWSMGLAPTWTRFTASLLDDFGLDHHQSALKDLHLHRSVISQVLYF